MCIFMHNTKLHFIGITAEGKYCQTYVRNAMYGYTLLFLKFLNIQTTSISASVKLIASFGTASVRP